ncbi:hypothetical protein [[Acidovorax] ebreus]|uniref:Uncharacterized protein n=1 Tax=Acidovorax ebreus (strain TPSY) TaxID=535289 RepID=A0A9J9QBN2_ACIET|nr:hypothetical protein [[Acidovorax] ebreus]ACM33577.1 hypothetical protein Dtpsy_2123 [[Acidovorax] ebreus TPSY]
MTDPTQPSQPTLPIRRIVQGKNPREYFDPAEMAELEEGTGAAGMWRKAGRLRGPACWTHCISTHPPALIWWS